MNFKVQQISLGDEFMETPRNEYPRPDFVREHWLNLNGTWEFTFDGTYCFENEARFLNGSFERQIIVPYPYQSKLSGIGITDIQPCVWYRRYFSLPESWRSQRILLHFGAVDYLAKVWINGHLLGEHRGGHIPFSFEITEQLQALDNEIVVKVIDTLDRTQPRGKQSWASPVECWYTQTTGIWQTVWLEAVPAEYLESVRMITNFEGSNLEITARIDSLQPGLIFKVEALFNGQIAGFAEQIAEYPSTNIHLHLNQLHPWSPEQPDLYDLRFTLLRDERTVDTVKSYFGLRKIRIQGNQIYLNNQPYFQRLILDQGFWPDGLYTAPSDLALRTDIEWGKKLGFNGCRKHMKVEDPRFLYWADRLGYLVWGEFPACYDFNLDSQAKFLPEWMSAIFRDYNHPSIIAWVPYNESWGISGLKNNASIQAWLREVVYLTRMIDPTRLVIDNDGWEHLDSDIYGYHDYAPTGTELARNYRLIISKARGEVVDISADIHLNVMMAEGFRMPERPVMLTEFGGIGYAKGNSSGGWGYAELAQKEQELIQRYRDLLAAASTLPGCCGYVYTQLTDVEQEINGLLTSTRQPKLPLETLKQISVESGKDK
jgi:beta-galactosidase/beta-glucuronidase